jgi:predicted MFS family arabinose efflux permease
LSGQRTSLPKYRAIRVRRKNNEAFDKKAEAFDKEADMEQAGGVAELRRGWRELVGAMLGLGCGIGAYTPVSSLFFLALEKEFGWSKTAGSIAFLALPLTAAVLPFAGLLLDRFGARRVALCGATLLALSFFLLSGMGGGLPAFYAIFIGLNIVGSVTGPISYTRAVAASFERARGLALALALLGIAGSGVLLPMVLGPMLAAGGWRAGYLLLAALALGGGLLAFALIRPAPPAFAASAMAQGMTLRQALRTRAFWCLAIAVFCVSAGSIGFVSQFQSVMIEAGLPAGTAIALLSTLSASVFLSRVLIGWALDRARPEFVAAAAMLLPAAGIGLWIGVPGQVPAAALAVVLIGASIGAEMDLLSFFCARDFGLRHFSAVYGGLAVLFYLGIGCGAVMYGVLHDRGGSYLAALLASSVLFLVAAGFFLALRPAAAGRILSAHAPEEHA